MKQLNISLKTVKLAGRSRIFPYSRTKIQKSLCSLMDAYRPILTLHNSQRAVLRLALQRSLSMRKLRGISGLFSQSLCKNGFRIGLITPKLFTQVLYSTIMVIVKWERDLWWLSFFRKSENDFDQFLIERPPDSLQVHL